ncbi:ankyrin-3-like [Phaenicophaeus curvirostris]|uniref:ankyrin-3-like n=1 Tax=Phaenicophaeus curvirostris TaxID=33595 RepID=UPI0037F0A183
MAQGERETLLALQRALTDEQFQSLKFLLEEQVPLGLLLPATRPDLCRLLLQRFPGQALRVTAELLRQIGRHDLLQKYQLPGAEDEATNGSSKNENANDSSKNEDANGCSKNEDASGCSKNEDAHRVSSPRAFSAPRRLSEKELMQVAQKLGREWQEVGIVCLGLERNRLDQIREDNPRSVVLQSFEMLREWRRRHKDEATASRLWACLAPASLDPELLDLLQSFQKD